MQKWLRISNKGLANYEALTTLGISTSRHCGKEGVIGMFGDGFKHSIATLLRNGLMPIFYSGTLQMHFNIKRIEVEDQNFHKIYIKYAGSDGGKTKNSTKDTGFTTEWGALDWTTAMACREFVANAIDGSIRTEDSYSSVEVDIVDTPRAKRELTQIFIPIDQEVLKFYQELSERFLHFKSNGAYLNSKLLPKLYCDDKIRVYKQGVLVSIMDGQSVFDYNLGSELRLNESRNASDWDVKYAIAQAYETSATSKDIGKLLVGIHKNNELLESKLDTDYMMGRYLGESKQKEIADKWSTAWKNAFGDTATATTGMANINEFIKKKGFVPINMPNKYVNMLDKFKVSNENSVLTGLEKRGRIVNKASNKMVTAVDTIWDKLSALGMVNNKSKPEVKGFDENMVSESQVFGEYENNVVYLHNDLGDSILYKVALEEIVHHITQCGDMSRDLQDYLFRLATKILF